MKRLLVISMVLVSAVLLIAGCDVSTPGVTYTVSGTISAQYYLAIASPASITITQGGTVYAVSIVIPTEVGGVQIGTYSIPNVPPGDYMIEAVFTSPYTNISASYEVDGSAVAYDFFDYVIVGSDYEWTVRINSLSISANATIDVFFNDILS